MMNTLTQRRRLTLLALIVGVFAALAACAGNSPIDVSGGGGASPTPSPSGGTSPLPVATVSFVTDVYPAFTTKACNGAGCHTGAAATASSKLTLGGTATAAAVYSNLISGGAEQTATSKDVDTGAPANSLLLTKPLNGHGGGTQFPNTSDPVYQLILNWITQGAQNN